MTRMKSLPDTIPAETRNGATSVPLSDACEQLRNRDIP
jgi:hypothetical protein